MASSKIQAPNCANLKCGKSLAGRMRKDGTYPRTCGRSCSGAVGGDHRGPRRMYPCRNNVTRTAHEFSTTVSRHNRGKGDDTVGKFCDDPTCRQDFMASTRRTPGSPGAPKARIR